MPSENTPKPNTVYKPSKTYECTKSVKKIKTKSVKNKYKIKDETANNRNSR